jgi:hypothetical protein
MPRLLVCILIILSAKLTAATPLQQGLQAFARDPEMRRNSSPMQSFYIAQCGDAIYRWRVYWPEARYLLLIAASKDQDALREHLLLLTKTIDLEHDLVNSVEEVAGSTYMETEADIKQKLQCPLKGKRFLVPISVDNRLVKPVEQ